MYQGVIEDKTMTITHKNQNLTEFVIFLEQQYGKTLPMRNKTFAYPQESKMYFLCQDKDFANFLAEILGIYTLTVNGG